MSHPKQLIDKRELTKLVKYSPQHIARLEKAGQISQKIAAGPEPGGVVARRGRGMDRRTSSTTRSCRFDFVSGTPLESSGRPSGWAVSLFRWQYNQTSKMLWTWALPEG